MSSEMMLPDLQSDWLLREVTISPLTLQERRTIQNASAKDVLQSLAGLSAAQSDRVLSLLFLHLEHEVRWRLLTRSGSLPAADDIPQEEVAMLRPMAETLAMIEGDAFFQAESDSAWLPYIPLAKAIFEANGGKRGWAGRASFSAA